MRFVILHGTLGSPQENWFPWLAGELEKLGHQTLRPNLPTPEGQNSGNWLKVIQEQVEHIGGVGDDLVFVAHSMSPLSVCQYLTTISVPVGACFFVSGFASKYPDEEPFSTLNKSFLNLKLNWDKIRRNCRHFICFAGDDDPYVPQNILHDFASKLGTELVIIPGGGHLNAEFGFTKFPQLLDSINTELNI